jgi:hypothetical protein
MPHLSIIIKNNPKLLNLTFYINVANKKYTAIQNNSFTNMSIDELVLTNNNLQFVEEFAFEGITSLQSLNLAFNRLRSLNNLLASLGRCNRTVNKMSQMNGFKKLVLDYNKIGRLDYEFPATMASMTHLLLKDNLIEFIGGNVFRNLGKLKQLIMINNPVGKISFALNYF